MKKVVIILNPKAGKKKKKAFSERINDLVPEGIEFTLLQTQYPMHAAELAKNAVNSGAETIVAVGGDGTVNEIASQLVNTSTQLLIIPRGSGNGLARHLGIPMKAKKAFKLLKTGKPTAIDVGVANEGYFFCAAGVGFDAEVSLLFKNSKTRGLISYLLLGFKAFLHYTSKVYRFSIDGVKYERKAFFISIANANQFGNNAYISPHSKTDDGLLDIAIVKPFNFFVGIFLFKRLFDKTVARSKYYETVPTKHIQFDLEAPTHYHTDGEVHLAQDKLTIGVIEKGLRVVVPLKKDK